MALDVFANFERKSNNPTFYRETGSNNYTFLLKLSDTAFSTFSQRATANYTAAYALNNSESFTLYDFISGANITFERRVPCVSSVQIYLSAKNGFFLDKFSMSAVFVDEFPTSDFIAYPSSYFNDLSGIQYELTSQNYFESPGVSFYGEGHTETINLSSKFGGGIWLIGNKLNKLQTSLYPVTADGSTTVTQISSRVSQNEKIPIHLRLTTNQITTAGPVITYKDTTGKKEFYDFFKSTITPEELEIENTTNLKSSIHVKPYPHISQYKYSSPFIKNKFNLPHDYANQQFFSSVEPSSLSSVLIQDLRSTAWELEAVSKAGDWTWTKHLGEINLYYFPLGYDIRLDQNPAFLKISPLETTTVTQTVSVEKLVRINFPPYDWEENTQVESFSSTCVITPIPYFKIYIPNFLNLRNQEVLVRSLELYSSDNFILKQVRFEPEDGTTHVLSGDDIKNPFSLTFEALGIKTLSAFSVFYNQDTNQDQMIVSVFPDMVQIVEAYDEVEEKSYKSRDSFLTNLPLTAAPLVSPNEWAVEDNINSIIRKLYNCVEYIKDYTLIYDNVSSLYGWLGNSVYSWSDIECPPATPDSISWSQHEVCVGEDKTSGYPIFWMEHECSTSKVVDPSCLQKYCLEWKWKLRKRYSSEIFTTWKDSKANGHYAKKWKYESCEIDSEKLNCDKGKWYIRTLDPEFFPIPLNATKPVCDIKGILKFNNDQLIVAHSTEINLVDESYQSSLLARRGIADEIFSFVNIEAISSSAENRLYVLDSVLPKICVFEIKDNNFVLSNSWGKFGLKRSLYGFNKPKDVHVNQKNQVLVTDSGNKCIKKYSAVGKHLQTFDTEVFTNDIPLSVCQDSNLNMHVLFSNKVIILNENGSFLFDYPLNDEITKPVKISCSYNKEIIYIAHTYGIAKYFKNGSFFEHLVNNLACVDGIVLSNYYATTQDSHRNSYVAVGNKVLKFVDRMELKLTRSPILSDLRWELNQMLIHKEEYIQPWVYLKAFHRLWDNIETLRNSLYYQTTGCTAYTYPEYSKADLTIGQNEIVTNAVINRATNQLWTNIQSLIKYFDPNCEN